MWPLPDAAGAGDRTEREMSQATMEHEQIADDARELRTLTQRAVLVGNADTFETLEARFSQFDKVLRTALQTWSISDVERIAAKLEDGGSLTDAELALLREVIAGDGVHFMAVQNQIEEWLGELSRLSDELHQQADTVNPDSIPQLRSMVQNAIRLLPHLRHYAAERERLERFDNAVNDLSTTARRVLAESLRVRLEHPEL